MIEDVGGFDHFDHKGGLPGMNFILCADASEDAVHNSDACAFSRYEGTNLCHKHDQGNLAEECGFSTHIRSGNDTDDLGLIHDTIIWYEPFLVESRFHHRMPAIDDFQNGVF